MIDVDSLMPLVGKEVKVNRNGPEHKVGKLLSLKPDHLVLYCEDEGVIYYNTQHIKSLSSDMKQEPIEVVEAPITVTYSRDPMAFEEAENFTDLLGKLSQSWVQINRGGPDKLEGILLDANEFQSRLLSNNEVITLMNFHIKSINQPVEIMRITLTDDSSNDANAANNTSESSNNNKSDNKGEKKNSKNNKKNQSRKNNSNRKGRSNGNDASSDQNNVSTLRLSRKLNRNMSRARKGTRVKRRIVA